MSECTFAICDRRATVKGLCRAHYYQRRRGNELTPLKGVHTRKTDADFWNQVDLRDMNGCWLWTGWRSDKGYGFFRAVGAHRYSWELLRGPIPDDYVVDHDHPVRGCHNPSCVNPDHLDVVTREVNMQRRRGAQVNNAVGERGVFWHAGAWQGNVTFTVNGETTYLKLRSPHREVVSEWVVEMRQKYHN